MDHVGALSVFRPLSSVFCPLVPRAMSKASPHPNTGAFPKGMSQPSLRALAAIGVTHLDQVPAHTEQELAALHGMGQKGIRVLREALEAQGKAFRVA